MRFRLDDLADPTLAELVEETLRFNAGFEAAAAARPPADLSTPAGLKEAREMASLYAPDVPEEGTPAEDRMVSHDGHPVGVRIIRPAEGAVRGLYLDIHGGGFFLGSAAMGDRRNRRLADGLGMVVVSVDYRLAPEHPWPAGPTDCEAAARWLVDQSEALGSDRLFIGGASAGANLVLTTLFRLRADGLDRRFSGANLVYGAYDLSGRSPGSPAGRDHAGYREAYLSEVPDEKRTDPDISPLYGDLAGLPPALITVGTRDALLMDSLMMAVRLAAAEVDVELNVYPESLHGFNVFPTAMADRANADIEAWLGARLAAG